jgi:hypothetical protein
MPVHIVTAQEHATFALPEPGQYTLHLRPADRVFADRRTVLVGRRVVRDNADAEGVERQGEWSTSRNILEFYGSDYEFAATGSGARFTWTLVATEGGRYAVQACWASGIDRSTDAPYAILRDGTTVAEARVDQTINGGTWVDLGQVDLEASTPCTIVLSADAGGEVVIADAVRLVLLDAAGTV